MFENFLLPAFLFEYDWGFLVHASNDTAEVPVGRLGTPGEVADTVLWMINTSYGTLQSSPVGSSRLIFTVTNKVIAVDGGMVPQH